MTSERGPFTATLPGRYYHDPAVYAAEQERIFGRLWTCVGRAEALARPGDYVLAELDGESIIVVRAADGQLRAHVNVCRHRGARLCTDARGHLRGAIQCPYHAWTYGLDGRLTGAPNALREPGFDRDARGLLPIRLEVWQGLIWLNPSDQPGAVDDQVADGLVGRFGSRERFERYRLGELTAAYSITYEVRANWKIIVENYTECDHCAPVHPEFVALIPGFKAPRPYSGPGYAGTPLGDGVGAFSVDGRARLPRLPGLLPEDDRLYYGFTLPTNVLISLFHDHVVLHTLFPRGPGRTTVVCDWLFDPAVAARRTFKPKKTAKPFHTVNKQDWVVCELTQQGVASRAFRPGGIYAPSEYELRLFNDWVLAQLGPDA